MRCHAGSSAPWTLRLMPIRGWSWPRNDFDTLSATSRIPAQLYAALISSSDDAIVLKSLDGVILTWNQGAMRMYGYTPDEVIGQPMAMLCPPERSGEIADILAKVRSGERISHYDTMRQRKDGTAFPVSVSVSPVNDEYGTTIGAASIARDITEQSQARAAAALAARNKDVELANQNLTSFTYPVSHDLRSPLRALAGYSSCCWRSARTLSARTAEATPSESPPPASRCPRSSRTCWISPASREPPCTFRPSTSAPRSTTSPGNFSARSPAGTSTSVSSAWSRSGQIPL